MARYEVSFTIELPDGVSSDEAEAFLKFELGALGGIGLDNPLADTCIGCHEVSDVDVRGG